MTATSTSRATRAKVSAAGDIGYTAGTYELTANNAANMTVNLVKPGTLYGDRINQLDLRVARTFRMGRVRTTVGLEVYNALNSSAVLSYNNTYVPQGPWLQPLAILSPRFLKFTGEIDF